MNVSARIICEIEIHVGDWSSKNASFDDLKRQVSKEGIRKLESLLTKEGGHVVGNPQVKFVMAVEGGES